jgi:phosphoglycolate phosphatase-like HAD superfamily hydrolase/phosphatidylglycerophosphate synthase
MIFAKLWISPHAVTSINILVGLLAGVFLAGKGYYSLLIGAALFQIASVTDGVDGELAKLTFRASKFGQYIDTVSDNIALTSVLVGLTVGSYRTLESTWVFVAGGIAIGCIGIILCMMVRFLKRNTDSASLVTFDKEYLQKQSTSDHPVIMTFLRYTKHTAKKDVFSFMIFCCAVAGAIQYWIFFIAFGAFLGAISLVYLNVADALRARASAAASSALKKLTKMVVFDFDGTLVNSMEAFADIAADVMPKYYPITAREARVSYLRTSGIPFFQQLETLFPNDPANEKAAAEFEETKKLSYFEKPVFEDAAGTLEALRRNNIKVAVSSNNFQDLVDQYVARKGIEFDAVLGYREGFAKGEDHFRHIEEKYGISRREIAFVGDSLKDGERAASSGVAFIGKEGIFSKSDFRRHFPDATVVSSLEELRKIL